MVVQGRSQLAVVMRVLHLILDGHLNNTSGVASKLGRDEFESLLMANEVNFGLFMSARIL